MDIKKKAQKTLATKNVIHFQFINKRVKFLFLCNILQKVKKTNDLLAFSEFFRYFKKKNSL